MQVPKQNWASSKAAGEAGTIQILSTFAKYSVEEVAAVATGPIWLGLYFLEEPRGVEKIWSGGQRK